MIVPSSGARRRISIGDCTLSTLSLSLGVSPRRHRRRDAAARARLHVHPRSRQRTRARRTRARRHPPPLSLCLSLSLSLSLFVSLSLCLSLTPIVGIVVVLDVTMMRTKRGRGACRHAVGRSEEREGPRWDGRQKRLQTTHHAKFLKSAAKRKCDVTYRADVRDEGRATEEKGASA